MEFHGLHNVLMHWYTKENILISIVWPKMILGFIFKRKKLTYKIKLICAGSNKCRNLHTEILKVGKRNAKQLARLFTFDKFDAGTDGWKGGNHQRGHPQCLTLRRRLSSFTLLSPSHVFSLLRYRNTKRNRSRCRQTTIYVCFVWTVWISAEAVYVGMNKSCWVLEKWKTRN